MKYGLKITVRRDDLPDVELTMDLPDVGRGSLSDNNPAIKAIFDAFDEQVNNPAIKAIFDAFDEQKRDDRGRAVAACYRDP